jgi:pimeloyl-ACP methyl ester carboxylesterase
MIGRAVMHSLRTTRTVSLLALSAWVGCATEPVGDGLFAPPTQNLVLFSPEAFGLSYEAVELPVDAPSPHVASGWFIPATAAQGTVLLHHGAISNRSAYFDSYTLLHNLGWNVFVYDYHGFGESRKPPSLESLVPDADAALSYLRQRTGDAGQPIVLFGISLGTLPALAQAARTPDGVAGVILEGSFVFDLLPPKSFLLIGIVPLPRVLDRLPQELDPYRNVGQITLPKLFLQSPQDLTTPIEGARRLFELASEPKQFVEVFGGHTLAAVLDPEYPAHLNEFLLRVGNDDAIASAASP